MTLFLTTSNLVKIYKSTLSNVSTLSLLISNGAFSPLLKLPNKNLNVLRILRYDSEKLA